MDWTSELTEFVVVMSLQRILAATAHTCAPRPPNFESHDACLAKALQPAQAIDVSQMSH